MDQYAPGVPELTTDLLCASVWLISRNGQAPHPGETFLHPDGSVSGMRLGHFAFWGLEAGRLVFMDGSKAVTVRFDPPTIKDGGLRFTGDYIGPKNPDLTTIQAREYRRYSEDRITGSFDDFLKRSQHLRNHINEHFQPHAKKWSIGDHSYGHPSIFEPSMARLTIGRFVSIAGGAAIALGAHRTDTVSSYPFAALRHVWPGALRDSSHDTKGDVTIGNDVWIGYNAFIGSGITVGDGAVIAASATVTRNVPPYAILAGNPGRIVRYRFAPDVIEQLLRIQWWNWDDEMIAAVMPTLTSGDINSFLSWCEERGLLPHEPDAKTDSWYGQEAAD